MDALLPWAGALLSFLGLVVALPDAALHLWGRTFDGLLIVRQKIAAAVLRRTPEHRAMAGAINGGATLTGTVRVVASVWNDTASTEEKISRLLGRIEDLSAELRAVDQSMREKADYAQERLNEMDARLTTWVQRLERELSDADLRQTRYNAHGLVITPIGILVSTLDPDALPVWLWVVVLVSTYAWACWQITNNIREERAAALA